MKKPKGSRSYQFSPSRLEICRRLKIAEQTLLRWLKQGMPHTVDENGVIVVDIDELRKFAKKRIKNMHSVERLPRYEPPIDVLCTHFNCSRQTIATWVRKGMPNTVEGGVRRVNIREVEEWRRQKHIEEYRFV